jgi:glycosyltransferase involved in cell wall biosynthesis
MTEAALVSIVMPVKNASQYLRECLDSLLLQSLANWELLVVDDHSEDNSFFILQEYALLDSRIKVLQLEKNKNGIIPALQLAYSNSSGAYVTRMDADDLMSDDKLSLMSSRLRAKGKGFVAIGWVSYFSGEGVGEGYKKYASWLNELTGNESNFSEIYKECVVPSPCWMMERSDFELIGGFESDLYPEDYDLCFRMRKHTLKITGIKEVLHYWRDHTSRASRNDPNYKDNRFLTLKMSYFLNEDLKRDANLILWGAGKKGKEIAKVLLKKSAPFIWMSNNPKKIGHNIYGVFLQSDDDIDSYSNLQVIIAIAKPDERRDTIATMESMGLVLGADYFPYC